MATVKINVDWVGHNFGAAPQDDAIACVATGKTLEEVEHNIVEAIRFHLEGMQAHGESLPVGFQDGWQPEFILTTRAQLRYTDNFITRKALSRETGINEQQLSHYATGRKTPRPDTRKRITDGIQAISRHLAVLF